MPEIIEAQEKFSQRQSEKKPESQTPTDQNPVATAPEGNWFSRLVRLVRKRPVVVPPKISEVAIDKQGEAIHGIGNEVSEEELSKLEQGGKSGESTVKPSESTPPSGSQPYRTPDGEFGLKVQDKAPDQADAGTEPNPEYDANTAPENISPINESVVSDGRLPTETQEESVT